MLKKFIFPLFLIFFLSDCGYTPIYLNSSETNFEISKFKINGNNEVNSIVKNKLKKYLNNNHKKKYNIEILTSYKKMSVAKDATGNTTNLKLIIGLNLNYIKIDTKPKNQIKNIFFSEELNIKRNQNNYEQNNYEQIIFKNMTEILTEKIILHLSRS
tara:strand:- start:1562 stop:2032 length:471 start_codon:yes stop_codon:yes gene_type:complete